MPKFKTAIKIIGFSGLILAAGCQASNPTLGQAGSSIAGNLLTNQLGGGSGSILTKAAEALAGGVIGGSIGNNLDNRSRNAALTAEYNALERGATGQAIAWQGVNGESGQVIPQQPYQVGSQNCRRYTHTINVSGSPQEAIGTACRNVDGTWTPLS